MALFDLNQGSFSAAFNPAFAMTQNVTLTIRSQDSGLAEASSVFVTNATVAGFVGLWSADYAMASSITVTNGSQIRPNIEIVNGAPAVLFRWTDAFSTFVQTLPTVHLGHPAP